MIQACYHNDSNISSGAAACFSSSCILQKTDPKTGQVSDTPVALMDVYQEFNQLSEKFRIMKFKSKVGLWNVD